MAWSDWDPQVQAATITSSVAVTVAVIGIIGTAVFQVTSASRAQRNALDLFKEQTAATESARAEELAAQDRARAEEFRERVRLAHYDDRKHAYVSFLATILEYADAVREEDEASAKADALIERKTGNVDELNSARERLRGAGAAREALGKTLMEAAQTVVLVGPVPLGLVAVEWMRSAQEGEPEAGRLNTEFIRMARADLGASE